MSVVEPAAGGSGPNRLFIVLAVGLVGLLVLGVVVIGGIFAIQQMAKPAAGVPTTTRVAIVLTTPTRAALVVLTPTTSFTDTPPLPTLVIQPASGATTPVSGGALTPTTAVTGTVTPGTGTPGSGMPPTGVGEDLLLLAGGVVLVFVIIAARRARTTMAA